MKRIIELILAAIFVAMFTLPLSANAKENKIILFWAEGCPHCAAESRYLDTVVSKDSSILIEKYEVTKSKDNQNLLVDWSKKLNFDPNGVPITIIGNQYILGYMEGVTDQKIESALNDLHNNQASGEVCKIDQPCDGKTNAKNQTIKLPFLGQIETKNFSLPILSAVIGLLDGFNPCALWVLLFLASLLIESGDRKKMLIYGGAFCLTEAITYALFMTAWLNILLFIGFVIWIRIAIGVFAIGAGGFNIKEWWANRKKDSGCSVTNYQQKKKIMKQIKNIARQDKMVLAVLGIIVLAFCVNLIELLCSAGLPAIYTQVLAMHHLSSLQYAFYIFLYICFFMVTDAVVFGATLITFNLKGISTKTAKHTHLIGGIIMLILGLLLLFKPSLLMFG